MLPIVEGSKELLLSAPKSYCRVLKELLSSAPKSYSYKDTVSVTNRNGGTLDGPSQSLGLAFLLGCVFRSQRLVVTPPQTFLLTKIVTDCLKRFF